MSTVPSLFLQPVVQRTANISNPPIEVLSAQDHFCTIDSILAINISNIDIFVAVYISTNNFMIIPPTKILANSTLQLLKESYFSLVTGEAVFASSNSNQNLFNINVEGRVFSELV